MMAKDFKYQQDNWMEPQPAPQLAHNKSAKSIEPSIDTQKLIEFSKYNNLNMHESNQLQQTHTQPKSRHLSRNQNINQQRTGDDNMTT